MLAEQIILCFQANIHIAKIPLLFGKRYLRLIYMTDWLNKLA